MVRLQKTYYFGAKDQFPEEITKGNILYDTENNGLYIDSNGQRNQVNAQADWNETNEDSPSFIANKPEILPQHNHDASEIVSGELSADVLPRVSQGQAGIAPAPTSAQSNSYLRGDGTWFDPKAVSAPEDITDTSEIGTSNLFARQDHTHGIDLETGDFDGQVKIAGTNVDVKGLKSAAFTDSDDYALADHTHPSDDSKLSLSGGEMTGRLIAKKGFNQLLIGTGEVGKDNGAGADPRYMPTKWTFNAVTTLQDGDIFVIKVPCNGSAYGIYLSVDNGNSYYPLSISNRGKVMTQYVANDYLMVCFNANYTFGGVIPIEGGSANINVIGVWQVLNSFTTSTIIPSGVCTAAATSAVKSVSFTYYALLRNSYFQIIMQNSNSYVGELMLNVNARGNKKIYINGEVSSETNHTLPAGSYFVFYDGTNYHFRTDGKMPGLGTMAYEDSGDYALVNHTHPQFDTKLSLSGGTMTGRLTAPKGINQLITGTSTIKEDTDTMHYPTKWKFDTGITPVDGDTFWIKTPDYGNRNGVYLSVQNGSNSYPVVDGDNNPITTQYTAGYYLLVVFVQYVPQIYTYPYSGGSEKTYIYSTSAWRVVNKYDSDTITSVYCKTESDVANKKATCSVFNRIHTYLPIVMENENTYQGNITLSINNTIAGQIYINDRISSSSNYNLPAGSYLVYYDGIFYYFRTDGKIPNLGALAYKDNVDITTLLSNIDSDQLDSQDSDNVIIKQSNTFVIRNLQNIWNYIKGKTDSFYATLSHTHSASDIDSGTLPVDKGGTGATTAVNARTNLEVMYNPRITTSAIPDTFDSDGLYHIVFNHNNDTTWPATNYGDLFVSNHGTAYQIYIPDNSMTVYKRIYSNSNSTWGAWSDVWNITATKAKQDEDGNVIKSTYAKLTGAIFTGDVKIKRSSSIADNNPARILFLNEQTDNNITTGGAYISVYDDHDNTQNGQNMVIRSSGNMFIGGGESPQDLYNEIGINSTSEQFYLTSDNNMYFYAKCQNISERLGMILMGDHTLLPIKGVNTVDNEGSIGKSDRRWKDMYATTFHGDLDGNATSATSATSATTATKFSSARKVELTGNVLGSATTDGSSGWTISTTVDNISSHGLSSKDLDDYKVTQKVNFYYGGGGNQCTNVPIGDGIQFGLITYASAAGHVTQECASYSSSSLHGKWIRFYNSTSWSAWEKFLTSGNYTDYTVTKTGTGATGTWGIGVSGNAGTATKFSSTRKIELTGDVTGSATTDGSSGWSIPAIGQAIYTKGRQESMDIDFSSTAYNNRITYMHAASNTTTHKPEHDANVINLGWQNNGTPINKWGSQVAVTNSTKPTIYLRGCNNGTWDEDWLTVLSSNNYKDYTVGQDGTGATGTWGIGISGNSATTTKLKTAVNLKIGNKSQSFDGSSGLTYNLDDLGITRNNIQPITSKTYTNILGTSSNTAAEDSFYFLKVRPDTFYIQWRLKYRIIVTIPGQNNFWTTSTVTLRGTGQANQPAYYIYNQIYSTSYRPIYYNNFYRLSSTGYDAGLSNAIGIGLRSSNNRDTSGYERTIVVEILENENCTYEFLDSVVKWANWTNGTTTNYVGLSEFDAFTNGQTSSGDRNFYDRNLMAYTHLTAGTNGIRQNSLVMEDSTGKWQSFTTDDGTGTSKTRNTIGFKLGQLYYVSTGAIASGNVTANNVVYNSIPLIDIRYSINSGQTLKANKPLWIVGTMNNGLFYLDATWWTQTPPTSANGKIYIYIGVVYNATATSTTAYQIDFNGWQGAYYHNGTAFIQYVESSGMTSVLPVSQGGTGVTSATTAASNFFNALNESEHPIKDDDRLVIGNTSGVVRRTFLNFWGYVKGKADAIYAAISHKHSATDITSGTLAVDRGGTGQTSLSGLATEMGLGTAAYTESSDYASSGHNHSAEDITSGTLPVARGGTGQTSLSAVATEMGLGTAAYTDSDDYASSGHTHPSDDTKLSLSGGTMAGRLTAAKGINQLLIGTGVVGKDNWPTTDPRYIPTKWTFDTGLAVTDGDAFVIKIPCNGCDYGVHLSIDNGENYHPVVIGNSTNLTTQFFKNDYLLVSYETDGQTNIMPAEGGSGATAHTGVWRVLNYRNPPDAVYPSAYCTSSGTATQKVAVCSNFRLIPNSYTQVIMGVSNTASSRISLVINQTGLRTIAINGEVSSSTNKTLPAGSYLVFYDGTYYHFRTDGKIPGLGGAAYTESSDYAAASHNHSASEITSGTLPVENGGTGQTSLSDLASEMGLGTAAYTDSDDYATAGHTHPSDSTKLSLSGGTMTGRLTTKKGINQIITGTGTAASDKGSGVTNRYHPAKWTFDTGLTATDGDTFVIKIPVAGHDYGIYLSIDNGVHYYPVVHNGTGRLTTHYPVNTYLFIVFEPTGSAASMYALDGGDARVTVTDGVWRVLNFYDANTFTSGYCSTAAGTAAKSVSCSGYSILANSYLHIIMVNANTYSGAITLNINSKGAKPIYINGSASSSSNKTLPAGSYLVYYDGSRYQFRTDGKIPGLSNMAYQTLGANISTVYLPTTLTDGVPGGYAEYKVVNGIIYSK